jgi:glycolate oxidase FAD binding subunit
VIANDEAEGLVAGIRAARARGAHLRPRGSGSKAFLYPPSDASVLSTLTHSGILDHRPEELVLTARAGTPLAQIRAVLAEAGQTLPFDPPEFGGGTLGGALATGLAGPGRPWSGAVRDAVLGVEIVNGLGERLTFGGQVMKNVAGYDVSRLLVGSHGTLALLLAASVKVLPVAEHTLTLAFASSRDDAHRQVLDWGRRPLPITATCHVDGVLRVRLSGTRRGVEDASRALGGEVVANAAEFWSDLRDQRLPHFSRAPLWRISTPAAAGYPELGRDAEWLTEWGGALRWLVTDVPARSLRAAVAALGGHAHVFSTPGGFAPVDSVAAAYHARVKAAFDPDGVFVASHFPVSR